MGNGIISDAEPYIHGIVAEMLRLREKNNLGMKSILRPQEPITDEVAGAVRRFFSVPGYNIIEIRKCIQCSHQWSIIIEFR
jgi:hypothetical protein